MPAIIEAAFIQYLRIFYGQWYHILQCLAVDQLPCGCVCRLPQSFNDLVDPLGFGNSVQYIPACSL